MELKFTKTNENLYEAVFEAPSDFNIHVERVGVGYFTVEHRTTTSGKYDTSLNLGNNGRDCVDYDFTGIIYPKTIKVISSVEIEKAEVTFV